ncbi:hypothetical protein Q8F87_29665, partial [Klebsiella variicola]|uniref:hypothetical protein n=1 Tax=Klebsiella variicola TaxID=244366 RepID=UPI0027314E28
MVGLRPDLDWVVPAGSVAEAKVAARGLVRPVTRLRELVDALSGVGPWPTVDEHRIIPLDVEVPDLADVKG